MTIETQEQPTIGSLLKQVGDVFESNQNRLNRPDYIGDLIA